MAKVAVLSLKKKTWVHHKSLVIPTHGDLLTASLRGSLRSDIHSENKLDLTA